MIWSALKDAPAPGTPLAALEDVPEGGALTRMIGRFPLLLVRRGHGAITAFVNLCPHQYLPLDRMAPAGLTKDGSKVICSNHGALFDVETGEATGGPCAGSALVSIPIMVREGRICVAA